MQTAIILCIVVFFASVVRGYTGFALSAIVVTSMSYWIPARELVPLVIPLEIIASLLFLRNVSGNVNWSIVGYIVAGAVISTPIATLVLLKLPTEITYPIIAALVLLATVILLSRKSPILKPNNTTWGITGLAMGFFGGLGSIGGLAGMVMLLSTNIDAAKTRATMIALLLLTSIYAASFSFISGMLTTATLQRSLFACIPMFAGLYLGHLCFKHYGRSFRTATLILLSVLSATMMLQSAWHFLR